jgi:hypothetical protein
MTKIIVNTIILNYKKNLPVNSVTLKRHHLVRQPCTLNCHFYNGHYIYFQLRTAVF